MAKSAKRTSRARTAPGPGRFLTRAALRGALRLAGKILASVAAFYAALILLYAFINPPVTLHMLSERLRLGPLERDWVSLEEMAPEVALSVAAAEDANFCLHWGFDIEAIRAAIDAGAERGASTLTQQVVKNTFLWHGRSWPRKAMEAVLTPAVELVWSKRRIIEVYLNVAEFGEGVFGIEAAAQKYFGVAAADLSAVQAARLAAVLPGPKDRDAAHPSSFLRKRAAAIIEGAATLRADGRGACLQD